MILKLWWVDSKRLVCFKLWGETPKRKLERNKTAQTCNKK